MKSETAIQPDLFSQSTGESLAVAGMTLAKESADNNVPGWSDRCWQLFWHWLNRKPPYYQFMLEQFRAYVYKMDLIEPPPSERAFAFLTKRALKKDLIGFVKTDKVKNRKAHSANANVWFKK